jgi:uncharacterized protein YycO
MRSILSAVLLWVVRFFQYLSGELRRQTVIARLRKADIILASPKTLRLSPVALVYRVLLSARYMHSMLYVGEGKMIHTTTKSGVVVDRLPKKIHKNDRYAIFRAKNLTSEQRSSVVEEALLSKNKKLDHAGLITNIPARLFGLRKPFLKLEKNRLWCSKLIYQAYSANGIDLVPLQMAGGITSEDLSDSKLLERIN